MTEHKTIVRKKIGRKIQPARFESLEVSCEWEDEITWSDPKDRQSKLDKITKAGLVDFQRSFDEVCNFLGVNDRAVNIDHQSEDGTVKKGAAVTPPASNQVDKKDNDDGDIFDGI
jgi:hypothetical protein